LVNQDSADVEVPINSSCTDEQHAQMEKDAAGGGISFT